jgi:uncharacterized protein YgiM (DUF1202 family)
MRTSYLYFSAILFMITSCSGDAGKFSGVWQSVKDPSKQIIFTRSGKTYTCETRNIESPIEGITGTYNAKEHALEFDHGNGDKTILVYNNSVQHILGLGEEFEKSTNAVADQKEDNETVTKSEEPAPTENPQIATNTTNCDKGDILMISGNNVRVRAEPDVTKQNILLQVHKGYEVVQLDTRTVDGQKWYKVCYDGNIGWVSGQYAVKK